MPEISQSFRQADRPQHLIIRRHVRTMQFNNDAALAQA